MSKAHKIQVLIGLAALGVGVLVYLVDRPAAQSVVPSAISLFALTPTVFGVLGHSLPTFVHVMAFILLTTAVLAGGKSTAVAVCLGWFALEAVFELGQHPAIAPALSTAIPSWFAHFPILNQTDRYFLNGTFDPMDLLAIVLGAAVAYVLIRSTERWRAHHE
jgi:hypothetical protein